MELTEKQSDLLKRRNLVVLATASLDNQPRAVIVEVNKAEGDRLIITDNEMGETLNNLIENNKVFILAFEESYNYCLKISGTARYCQNGEQFDFVKTLKANKERKPKGVVVIMVDNVIEFN